MNLFGQAHPIVSFLSTIELLNRHSGLYTKLLSDLVSVCSTVLFVPSIQYNQ